MMNNTHSIPNVNYKNLVDQLPFLCCWLDKKSNVIEVNKLTLDTFQFKSVEDVIGRNHYDQPWCEYADKFTYQDNHSLKGHRQFSIDKTVKKDGSSTILMVSKAPYLCDNSIQGITCAGFELTKNNYHHIITFLMSQNVKMSDFFTNSKKQSSFVYKNVEFSKRQAQIISHLLRGKTAEATAKILSRSPRTVEKHIEEIRHKLECESKSEIIAKAFEYGFIDLMFMQF